MRGTGAATPAGALIYPRSRRRTWPSARSPGRPPFKRSPVAMSPRSPAREPSAVRQGSGRSAAASETQFLSGHPPGILVGEFGDGNGTRAFSVLRDVHDADLVPGY